MEPTAIPPHKPPYTVTPAILSRVVQIGEAVGQAR